MGNYPIRTKRIYEYPSGEDGYRVLVDRLWPRGVSKEDAQLDAWLKDLAPSTKLRKWYDHDPQKFAEFTRRYEEELSEKETLLADLVEKSQEGPITLLYAAKDREHNQAIILAKKLGQRQS